MLVASATSHIMLVLKPGIQSDQSIYAVRFSTKPTSPSSHLNVCCLCLFTHPHGGGGILTNNSPDS